MQELVTSDRGEASNRSVFLGAEVDVDLGVGDLGEPSISDSGAWEGVLVLREDVAEALDRCWLLNVEEGVDVSAARDAQDHG